MLDLGFLACFIIAVVIGYKTGFLRALVSFAGVFVSAIGGYLLYPYVTPFLMKTPLYDIVNAWTVSGLEAYLKKSETLTQLESLFLKYNVSTEETLLFQMAEGITTVIFNVISVLVILILVKIIIVILKKVTNLINHIPVFGFLNRLLGMGLSGASFVTLCFIVVAVMLLPPSNTTEISRQLCNRIDESVVVSRVMEYNFFVNYKSLSQNR